VPPASFQGCSQVDYLTKGICVKLEKRASRVSLNWETAKTFSQAYEDRRLAKWNADLTTRLNAS
jgi:hypothetical protein